MKTISIFNNKGGVGKTTYMYHVAHALADIGQKVLMVDCDSQCNLTAYALKDDIIAASWRKDGNSIYIVLEDIIAGTGDFLQRRPSEVCENLYLIPGDINLSIFEDRLGDTWNSMGTQEVSLRTQIALFRYINWAANEIGADVILIDLGPNLGALNRSALAGSDYFITPLTPDLFSLKGTENLGNKFFTWSEEWDDGLTKWRKRGGVPKDIILPNAKPKFIGYVRQQYNARNTKKKMTKGWQLYGERIENAVMVNIVNKLKPRGQVVAKSNYLLGSIPNLHSLIPYSLEAKKPVYKCTSTDGLRGAHITKARESKELYDDIVKVIIALAS